MIARAPYRHRNNSRITITDRGPCVPATTNPRSGKVFVWKTVALLMVMTGWSSVRSFQIFGSITYHRTNSGRSSIFPHMIPVKTCFSRRVDLGNSIARRTLIVSTIFSCVCRLTSMASTAAATFEPNDMRTNNNPNLFWNREFGTQATGYDETSPIIKKAKILCLSDPDDVNNKPLYDGPLPDGCEIIHIGCTNLDIEALKRAGCNSIFVSAGPYAREPLQRLIRELGTDLEWIHSRSAGIDSFYSDEIKNLFLGCMTNAKGCYSSTLAEYTIASCLYFAKDFPKLLRQKQDKNWNAYPILELRGSTLGIVGFGDIGQAAGRLAVAFGMKVIALTRKPRARSDLLQNFPDNSDVTILDSSSTPNALNKVFAESDYILVATPLTKETTRLIGKEQFSVAKKGSVVINVGRGPVIDENELIDALQRYPNGDSPLKGAALDVTTIEPLPTDSPLWTLDNVLLSPHNMDMTTTFMLESTEFFVQEQLPRFVRGVPLLNPVNVKEGY